MRPHTTLFTALGFALAVFATSASATPIVYEFAGVATGTIGATSFSDTPFTISVQDDTDNVVSVSPPTVLCNETAPLTVAIAGVGTAITTEPLFVFATPGLDWVGIARGTCSPLALVYLIVANTAFSTYDLRSSIGPFPNQGTRSATLGSAATTLGELSLSGPPFSFQATLQAVPAPPTLYLVALALLVAGCRALLSRGK